MNNRKNKNEIKNVIDPFEIEIKPTEIADTVEEVNNETLRLSCGGRRSVRSDLCLRSQKTWEGRIGDRQARSYRG